MEAHEAIWVLDAEGRWQLVEARLDPGGCATWVVRGAACARACTCAASEPGPQADTKPTTESPRLAGAPGLVVPPALARRLGFIDGRGRARLPSAAFAARVKQAAGPEGGDLAGGQPLGLVSFR